MSETIYFRGIPYRRYPESKNRTHRLYFQRSAYKEFGGKTGFLHREVWEFYNGKIPKGLEIHHIDGDTTNNKISNLELLTHYQHAKKHNWGIWDGFNEHQKMLVQKAKQFVMNPETFTGEPDDGDHIQKDYFYQFRLAHELNDSWKMTNALSFKDAQLKGFSSEPRKIQNDAQTLERQRRYRDNKSDDALFQTEFLGTVLQDWAKHEILVSSEVGRLDYRQLQLRRNHSSSVPNTINIYTPVYGKSLPDLPLFINTEEKQGYSALNLQDQIFLNNQWSVLMGARFDHVTQDFQNKLTHTTSKRDFNQTSPRLGLNYRINDVWS